MGILPGRLGTLTARDVMTGRIIVLSESDTLDAAIQTLREHHITGAPVTDEQGRLIGILSLYDLVGVPASSRRRPDGQRPLAHGEEPVVWDLFEKAAADERDFRVERVADRMSRKVASVTAETPLVEVARAMCDGHWHRVPVVDEKGSLVGIITAMDVLAALVHAADELDG